MLLVENGMSHNTVDSYRSDIKDFDNFVANDLLTANEQNVKSYIKFMYNKNLSKRSVARKISSLRKFYEFALQNNVITTSPMQHISSPKISKSLPKILSTAEIKSLFGYAYSAPNTENTRIICLLELLYSTGMRVSELLTLYLTDILSILRTTQLPAQLLIRGKGHKERLVFVNKSALESIHKYIAIRDCFYNKDNTNKWLFASNSKQGHLTRQRFHQILKSLAINSGIDPVKVSPHVIRHAFASHLLNNGADLLSLQKLLGHQDITTTEIYTHIMSDEIEKSVLQNHPLSRLEKHNKP